MKIDKVTLTGADDSVRPAELVEISQQYPLVEWGILFSKSQQGTARFPHSIGYRNWTISLMGRI